jgi:predicted nucleic acid-binding Zn ribbon protein
MMDYFEINRLLRMGAPPGKVIPGYGKGKRPKKAPVGSETQEQKLTRLWMEKGCPEKMTIKDKTGEIKFVLVEGIPILSSVTDNPLKIPYSCGPQGKKSKKLNYRSLSVTCVICGTEFEARRKGAKYCSSRCRQKMSREEKYKKSKQETDQLLRVLDQ